MIQLATNKALSTFSIMTIFVAAGCLADGAAVYAQNRAHNKTDKKIPQLLKVEPQVDPEADKAMELPGIFKVTPAIAQDITQKGGRLGSVRRTSQAEFSADDMKVKGVKSRRAEKPLQAEKPARLTAAAPRLSELADDKRADKKDDKKDDKKEVKKILIPAPLTKTESFGGGDFHATAYSLKGRTATGEAVRSGLIAADPKVLPLGTLVQIEAGKYSGVYKVADTGGAIKGNKIDIYVPTYREAKLFGRQKIKVKVLGKGGKAR